MHSGYTGTSGRRPHGRSVVLTFSLVAELRTIRTIRTVRHGMRRRQSRTLASVRELPSSRRGEKKKSEALGRARRQTPEGAETRTLSETTTGELIRVLHLCNGETTARATATLQRESVLRRPAGTLQVGAAAECLRAALPQPQPQMLLQRARTSRGEGEGEGEGGEREQSRGEHLTRLAIAHTAGRDQHTKFRD